ncbi:hypothetical protein MK280_04995, partial [Myxococcota bacterium]|nr:hypothetical protein [Myxococcota bacterium]
MRAALGFSTQWSPDQAVSEAWAGIRQAWPQKDSKAPSAVIALATAASGVSGLTEMAERIAAEGWGKPVGIGASVEALEVDGAWWAKEPALALLALEGVEAHPFRAEEVPGHERSVAAEWAAEFPAQRPGRGDLMVVTADGLSVAADSLVSGLGEHLPGLSMIGFGATEPSGGPAFVWCEDEVVEAGCAGLLLRTSEPPRIDLVHPGTVLCEPIPITRSRGAWIYGLDGRPALEVLAQYQRSTSDDFQSVWVGLLAPRSQGTAADPDQWAIRSLTGLDRANGAFSVPAVPVQTGMELVFLSPEPFSGSDADLGGANSGVPGVREVCTISLNRWPEALGGLRAGSSSSVQNGRGAGPHLGVSAAYHWSRRSGQTAPCWLHTHSSVVASLL